MKALLVYPTHENCREAEQPYTEAGIRAACYPPRTTIDTEHTPQNCWNPQADEAEEMGFPVVKAVCPLCKDRQKCLKAGYLAQLAEVKEATVALCTHKRAEYSGFTDLTAGRNYVSIHENPIDILKPQSEVEEADLVQVQVVMNRLLNDPRFLDWFGEVMSVDDEGNKYQDEELAVRRERLYQFSMRLADMVDDLAESMQAAEATVEWTPKLTLKRPEGIERTLFWVTRVAKVKFDGQPWRFVLAAVTGELSSSAIIVSKHYQKGAQGEFSLMKTATGFRDNRPSRSATTWFNDATLSTDTLSAVLGVEVRNKTPGGRLELQKKAVQILRDITRSSSKKTFSNIIRGVLADRPQFARVGIICHRPHIDAIKSLEPEFANRVVKSTYFGSGEDRSSNAWHRECDLIIVAGTPRMPPAAIATYLVQIGDVGAACREPKWGTVKWDGHTESGEPVTASARGYHDEAWRRAQRDLVRAAIVQAVGRGRGILETGCEVIVLSTEECGLVISDIGMQSLNGSSARVVSAIRELTITNPNNRYLGKVIVSTSEIGSKAGLSQPRTRGILRDLERRGIVQKVGERGGWLLTETPDDAEPEPVETPS